MTIKSRVFTPATNPLAAVNGVNALKLDPEARTAPFSLRTTELSAIIWPDRLALPGRNPVKSNVVLYV